MWVFTRYGFVSAACAKEIDGTADPNTIMLRARVQKHLENLKKRFADTELGKAEILNTAGTDYRYRVILPKKEWAAILSELAMEQTWSNFKNESGKFATSHGESSGYEDALHDVWEVMWRLQK
jgi:hypothetical protein